MTEPFTGIPPLRHSPREALGLPRARHGAKPRIVSPGVPEVKEILRRCPWAGLYDAEGRAYGWLPRAHPLLQDLREDVKGAAEGVRNWSMEDMQRTEQRLAEEAVTRGEIPPRSFLRVKTKEEVEEDRAATDLMRIVKPEGKPVPEQQFAAPSPGLPVALPMPSGHHLLWVWLPDKSPGLWQKVKHRRADREADLSIPELDYPGEHEGPIPLFHWQSRVLVALMRVLYYPEWLDPRSTRRVTCVVVSLQWTAAPVALPSPLRFPQLKGMPGLKAKPLSPDPFARGKEEQEEEQAETKASVGGMSVLPLKRK